MSDIDSEIKQLKAQAENARRVKTRSDLQRDNARATVDKIVSRLNHEFGVNSLSEANDLLETIDLQLRDRMDKIKEQLLAFD